MINIHQSIFDYCLNDQVNGSALTSRWRDYDCRGEIRHHILFDPLDTTNAYIGLHPNRFTEAADKIGILLQNHLPNGPVLDVYSNEYSKVQELLHSICIDETLGGICHTHLKTMCQKYTRKDVLFSKELRNWCGCYVTPEPTILKATKNDSCDPVCFSVKSIRKFEVGTENGRPVRTKISCPQQVCAISNALVTQLGTDNPNGIHFNQLCGGCGANGCFCVVSSPDLDETLVKLGVVHLDQFCGKNSTCAIENEFGEVIKLTQCKDPSDASLGAKTYPTRPKYIVPIVMFIIGIFVFSCMWILIA